MRYQLTNLKSGLTLITINLPHLDSVTTLVAVGAGSRYETRRISGISHFLEHMFFKGSRKYPTAEMIAGIIDGIGAVNNAATDKEHTFYWIKSSAKHLELSLDVLSSMLKDPLLSEDEIEREKGVIVEELRMYRDNPARHVWDLYERLQYGDQPLGWDVGGDEATVKSLKRQDFVDYINSLYSPNNMVLVIVGKISQNSPALVDGYFLDLPKHSQFAFKPFKPVKQTKPKVSVFYKPTDQANLVLGVRGYSRLDNRRFGARLLGIILGEGMSSRLFIQVRERRGLAYSISAGHDVSVDTGSFTAYAGLRLDKVDEGLEVIRAELERTAAEKVTDGEIKKAKEIVRGRIALRSESTNFLAEHFGTEFVLDRKLESFEDYLRQIDQVTVGEIQSVAQELFKPERYNLQIIAPIKSGTKLKKILEA